MNKTATFFGNFGDICQSSLRWLIRSGRKNHLVPAFYLVFFAFAQIQYANRQVSIPTAPEPGNTPNTTPTAATDPASTTAAAIAGVKAYKSGNNLVIRWDKPVINQKILDPSFSPVQADCQPQVCTVRLIQNIDSVTASWTQGTENFSTKFKL